MKGRKRGRTEKEKEKKRKKIENQIEKHNALDLLPILLKVVRRYYISKGKNLVKMFVKYKWSSSFL